MQKKTKGTRIKVSNTSLDCKTNKLNKFENTNAAEKNVYAITCLIPLSIIEDYSKRGPLRYW